MKRKALVVWIIFTLVGLFTQPGRVVSAANTFEVVEASAHYSFSGLIDFSASVRYDTPPDQVLVFIRPENEAARSVQAVLNGEMLTATYDPGQQPITVFTEVTYWFGASYATGENILSQEFTFRYEDNRFVWQHLEEGLFRVNWYEGDLAFGQMLLDIAAQGQQRAKGYLPVSLKEPAELFVYASGAEMQSTLRLGNLHLIGGHADPELGVMVVSLQEGPDQRTIAERKIPHELMHILLYQHLGARYDNLPAWVGEGLPSLAELQPSPDYYAALQDAHDREALLPMTSLCHGFPMDAASFYLSYAQSESFTRYIYQTYGAKGLADLVNSYADGLSCEEGPRSTLGISLAELDNAWRVNTWPAKEAASNPLMGILPWLVMLALVVTAPLVLVVVNLFSARSPAPGA